MITVLQINKRETQRNWPFRQLQNATKIGESLSQYYDTHGLYPARLEELVVKGIISQKDFQKLQFKSEPKAPPQRWLYKAPMQISDIAIVAPREIYPWSGHSSYIVVARAAGGGELLTKAKQVRVPARASK